jgi:hypothetical protein
MRWEVLPSRAETTKDLADPIDLRQITRRLVKTTIYAHAGMKGVLTQGED